MGAYNELTDLEFCENNRRSRSSRRIVQSLFSIPNWIVLAGGMAIGSMLGQSSSSASPVEGVNSDEPMVESYNTKEIVSCGPWGGAGGSPFYDGRGDIVGILVSHNAERVLSIETSYNQGDVSFKAPPHGTNIAGAQSTQITLQFPKEYIVQVKGTIDTWTIMQARVVSSLTLVTNKRIYGPFGRESGTSFESLPGGQVVGFFGRSGTMLDQLGVLSHPSKSFSTTSATSTTLTTSMTSFDKEDWVAVDGPWGGNDGSLFHDGHGCILEIVVTYHETHVNSLQVFYKYGDAQFAGSVHGVPAGKESKILLHRPEEYLVKVKGTIGKISGHDTITSITFITNKCQFGPYGSPTGEAFKSSSGREVTGFFGRCNSRLGQIGVITTTRGLSNTAAVQGPWGAKHGSQFCSGRGELTEIYIIFTKAHLVALQTTYSLGLDMGNFKSDTWGGGTSLAQIEKISLRSLEEYLIQVKGTIDTVNGKEAVTSLTFITNRRTYGPYGLTSGKSFESTPAKIGGFFGCYESHIHQLGVITELSSDIQLQRTFNNIEERLLDGGKLVLNGKESNNHTDTAQKIEHSSNGIAHYPGSGSSYVTKYLVSSNVLVIQQGPWGDSSGQEFYDGRGDIVDLNISYNESLITSIQVGYEQGGTKFQAPLHGGKGTQHVKINMDSSIEHVLQVKGTSGLVNAAPAITSLIVVTNKATYGPYGSTQGKWFQSSREGTVVGIFGRASATLHQLGVITLINAAPSNGQCIHCATPYMYCCQCIVQHLPVPKPAENETITSVHITPNYFSQNSWTPKPHALVNVELELTPPTQPPVVTKPTRPTQPPTVPESTLPTQPPVVTKPTPPTQPPVVTKPTPLAQPLTVTKPTPPTQLSTMSESTPPIQPPIVTKPTPSTQPPTVLESTPPTQPPIVTKPTPHTQPPTMPESTPPTQPLVVMKPTPPTQSPTVPKSTLPTQPPVVTKPTPPAQSSVVTKPTPSAQLPTITKPSPPTQSPTVLELTPPTHPLVVTKPTHPTQPSVVTKPTPPAQLPTITKPSPPTQSLTVLELTHPTQPPVVTKPTHPTQLPVVTKPTPPTQPPTVSELTPSPQLPVVTKPTHPTQPPVVIKPTPPAQPPTVSNLTPPTHPPVVTKPTHPTQPPVMTKPTPPAQLPTVTKPSPPTQPPTVSELTPSPQLPVVTKPTHPTQPPVVTKPTPPAQPPTVSNLTPPTHPPVVTKPTHPTQPPVVTKPTPPAQLPTVTKPSPPTQSPTVLELTHPTQPPVVTKPTHPTQPPVVTKPTPPAQPPTVSKLTPPTQSPVVTKPTHPTQPLVVTKPTHPSQLLTMSELTPPIQPPVVTKPTHPTQPPVVTKPTPTAQSPTVSELTPPTQPPVVTKPTHPTQPSVVMQPTPPTQPPVVTKPTPTAQSPTVSELTPPTQPPVVTKPTHPTQPPVVTKPTPPAQPPTVSELTPPTQSPVMTKPTHPTQPLVVTKPTHPSQPPTMSELTPPTQPPVVTKPTPPTQPPVVTKPTPTAQSLTVLELTPPAQPPVVTKPTHPTQSSVVMQPTLATQPPVVTKPTLPTQPSMVSELTPSPQPPVVTKPTPPTQPQVVTKPTHPSQPPTVSELTPPTQPPVVTKPTHPTQPPVVTKPTPPAQPPKVSELTPPTQSPVVTKPTHPTQPSVVMQPTPPTQPPIVTKPTPPTQPPVVTKPTHPTQPSVVMQPTLATQPPVVTKPTLPTQPSMVSELTPSPQPPVVTKPTPPTQPLVVTKPTPAPQLPVVTKPTPPTQPLVVTKPTPTAHSPMVSELTPPTQPPVVTKPTPPTQPPVVTKPTPPTQPQVVTKPTPTAQSPTVSELTPPTQPPVMTKPTHPSQPPTVSELTPSPQLPVVTKPTHPTQPPVVTKPTHPTQPPVVTKPTPPAQSLTMSELTPPTQPPVMTKPTHPTQPLVVTKPTLPTQPPTVSELTPSPQPPVVTKPTPPTQSPTVSELTPPTQPSVATKPTLPTQPPTVLELTPSPQPPVVTEPTHPTQPPVVTKPTHPTQPPIVTKPTLPTQPPTVSELTRSPQPPVVTKPTPPTQPPMVLESTRPTQPLAVPELPNQFSSGPTQMVNPMDQWWFDWICGTHVDNVFTVEGPWGVNEETNFYDGNGDISEIEVAYSKEFILRIQTTYVLNGMSFKQSPQGGPGGNVAKVTLQYPDEYLVQVRGTTREVSSVGVAVTSLTFVTNMRTYGPYGSTTGGSSFKTRHGRVMGFNGIAILCLHSIGVLMAKVEDQRDMETVVVQKAWGGQGGVSFYEGGGEVIELLVSYSDQQVVSLQAMYRRGGKSFRSNQHGGQNGAGAKQAKITLKSPEEYLVQVKGSSHHVNGLLVIESLEFVTNKQRYGPYGALNPQGHLRSTQNGGKVVGFFGKAGHFLDQLGVIVSLPLQRHDLVTCQGSWGGLGGSLFSDGRGEIVELLVKYNKNQVVSLQVTYEQEGFRYKSQLRGGVGNGQSIQVSFEPEEYLVQVKGTTGGIVSGGTMVTSLTFITNKQTHGPFGAVMGSAFETKASGKVVGVFGSSGSFLDSIGFITELQPGKAMPVTVKLGPWGGQGGREFCCGQGDVVKVVVYHNRTQINGIQVTYEQGGVSFEPVTYGGTSGTASEISVDFPNEYVTQVQGTTAKVGFLGLHQVITSLTFITNKHKYGPYGAVKGSEFGSPPRRLLMGFYGRAGDSLDQFGVFTTVDWETSYAYLQIYRMDWTTTSQIGWATPPGGLLGQSMSGTLDIPSSPSSFESDHSSLSRSSGSSKSLYGSASSESESSSKSGNSSRPSSPGMGWILQMPSSTPSFGNFLESHSSDAESSSGEDGCSITGSTKVEGPWGGDGGDVFYDGTGDLHEIRVGYSEKHVTSLQLVYIFDGVVTEGTKIGGSPGDKFIKVVLKSPEEYIICIKGTFGVVSRHKIITSLTFISNKVVYGPYGTIEGQEFTSSGFGKVVGIFGSSGSCVDRLGVFSTTTVTTSSSIEGSWGGDGGYVFSDGRGDIVEITVTYNRDQIVSFQAIYNQNGTHFPSRLHGGYGGKSQSQTIVLNFPDEYLIQVQGTYGRVCALSNVITSLSFITSKKTYGPFGAISGQEFKTSEGTQVVGFHGRSCDFLDRFGVFTTKERLHGLSLDAERDTRKVLAQGPWGGAGGSAFYDGRGDIVEILIEYMEDYIVSLQATYEQGGGVFKTTARFGPGGETAKIKFDQEQEQLIQIQGSIGDMFDTDMITSLTFITTKKTYGPYGTVTDRKFESKKHGKVVGFFGRSDEFLDQIGVVTEYSPKDHDVVFSQGPWGGKNGTVFYDGKGYVVGIIVTYNKKQIISFQAIYSQGTTIFKADFHGGPGGKTAKIFFNSPSEELLQVKGTTGKVGGDLVVTSLTFCSNKRVFGPFGSVRDTKFESSPSGKVKGFYGKARVCLDQIGFITQFSPKKLGDEVVVQGPWGGSNGNNFYGGRGEILDIMVCYSKTQILSLQMTYEHNGASYKGEKQGANGGDLKKISLKETNSYLVQVKGTFGKVASTICITSLTLVTSKHTYGPFGSARGTHFQSYKNGKIVGLFGKASASIDQLGVITQICAESQVPKVQMKILGPWGGQGGVEFHDGHGHIRDIGVYYTNHQVVAFQANYEQGGIVLHGTNHGGTSKASRHVHHAKISFHDLDEYLIQIIGTYGLISGGKMITSLTFITNKQKYGPFGHEARESFYTPSGQKIMGFFGRAAAYLDQIGVVVTEEPLHQPLAISPKPPKLNEIEERVHVEGPWGVDQETNFYGGRGNIIEIEVAYNTDTILRIQTTFQENGTNFKQEALGGPGGDVAKITLQYPDEYLVQVKGTTREVYLVGVAVTTLTFITNKRSYGPYGSVTGGLSFETTQHGRVMGFYGRATSCLHSIGVLAEVEDLPNTEIVVVQDAWGGQGGEPFFDGRGNVTEVLVTYNDFHVVSLQITYRHGGKIFKAKQHGGQKGIGAKQAKITLNYPDEYLMQVRGSSHNVDGALIMESLDFITNKRSYGPYGALKPQGQLRTTPKNGKIVGFFGKAGSFLDQLGVIITFPSQWDDLLICQGSWGGPGGSSFCDGRGEIVELHVKYDKKQIISLQVTYEQGGVQYKSQLHGGGDNGESKKISFGPGEYLVQVKGTTGIIVPGGTMVTSLTIITNKQLHGPFGAVAGCAFETKASGKVVGLFGRSARFLDSIGFITELHPGKALPATVKLGPWGGQGGREFYGGQGDIVKVVVYHNKHHINGIQTTYEQGGVSFEPVTFGNTNGHASEISLNFPNEYLAQVKGTLAKVGSHQVITSLTFITNMQKYGPYGHKKGSNFKSPSKRLVTGFFGQAGDALDQFGIFATASSKATDRYLRVHLNGWKNSWGAIIKKEVSSAGKFFMEEFGKLPSIGHSYSQRRE